MEPTSSAWSHYDVIKSDHFDKVSLQGQYLFTGLLKVHVQLAHF